jgi:hypothetical protein
MRSSRERRKLTRFKHPVYPNVQFDAAEDSLFLMVDGDNKAMLDYEEVERLSALVLNGTTPKMDLTEFFAGLGLEPWAADAAANLFFECESEINNVTMK